MSKQQALRQIDKPFYHYWQALYLSFFSSRFYVDVGKRWRGFGIIYLFFLMCVVALPISLRVGADFSHFFNEGIIEPLQGLPLLYVQNGQISFDKPMPYFIKNKSGQVVSIIDTTGTIKEVNPVVYPDLAILITKDKIFYRFPAPRFFFSSQQANATSPVYIMPISGKTNEVFDGKQWAKSPQIQRTKFISWALIYPTMAAIFFSMYLILLLTFALMGQFFAKYLLKFPVSYKQACRLLMVSVTPHVIILLIALTLHWIFAGLGFVLIALLAAYFSFAVLALKRESQKLVRL